MSAATERAPATGFSVVLLTVLVFNAVVLVASLRGGSAAELDPATALAEVFEPAGDLPFGLELVSAVRLGSGDQVIVLAHPDYTDGIVVPELEEPPEPDGGVESDAQPEPVGKPSEGRAPEPIQDTPPVEVVVTIFRAPGAVLAQFEGLHVRDPRGMGGEGRRMGGESSDPAAGGHGPSGHWTVEFGKLEWAAYSARFVHERADLSAGRFRDSLRVNLSTGERYAVLSAQWPLQHAASKERVEELLTALRLKPPPALTAAPANEDDAAPVEQP